MQRKERCQRCGCCHFQTTPRAILHHETHTSSEFKTSFQIEPNQFEPNENQHVSRILRQLAASGQLAPAVLEDARHMPGKAQPALYCGCIYTCPLPRSHHHNHFTCQVNPIAAWHLTMVRHQSCGLCLAKGMLMVPPGCISTKHRNISTVAASVPSDVSAVFPAASVSRQQLPRLDLDHIDHDMLIHVIVASDQPSIVMCT